MVMLEKTELLTLERTLLIEVMKKLSYGVPTKSTIAILQAIKIEATKEHIIFTATDSDNAIVSRIENESKISFSPFVIEFKSLFNFLKKSKSAFITFDQSQGIIEVKASNINYKLTSYDAYEYPMIPKENFEIVTLSVDNFKNAIRNTCFAVFKTESRPILQAIHITYNSEGLQFIATDSHRLTRYKLEEHTNKENEIFVTPSGEILEKFTKLISKKTSAVSIGFSEKFTLLSFDNTDYYIRNLEGNYPNTKKLIPDSFDTEFTIVSRYKLLEALSTLELISKKDKNNVVKLEIEENRKHETTLSAEIKETSEKMTARFNVLNFHGKDLIISFSGQYLKETINALDSDDITFEFKGSMRPFVVTSVNDKNALHLILPCRTY